MPSTKRYSISIFFPCYNDANSISELVNKAFSVVKKLTNNYEIIVIDDGSTDKSRSTLIKLKKRYSSLKLVYHKKNQGYGGALQSGFKYSSKDLVFYTDGDGQYDINELPILVSLMSEDVDFINGIKMTRNDDEYRVIAGHLHRFLMRWFFWLPINDVDCDFRLIRSKVVKKLKLISNTGAICVELVKRAERAGARFREVEVHHYERKWGKSQFFKLYRILATYGDLIRLWFRLMVLDLLFKH